MATWDARGAQTTLDRSWNVVILPRFSRLELERFFLFSIHSSGGRESSNSVYRGLDWYLAEGKADDGPASALVPSAGCFPEVSLERSETALSGSGLCLDLQVQRGLLRHPRRPRPRRTRLHALPVRWYCLGFTGGDERDALLVPRGAVPRRSDQCMRTLPARNIQGEYLALPQGYALLETWLDRGVFLSIHTGARTK